MSTYVVRSMSAWLSLMTPGNTPGFSSFINVVIGVSVIIGFMVIFQAMYTAVMERTREIGILKSIGASKFYIINVILRETTLLALCGIALGIVLSIATAVPATAAVHRLNSSSEPSGAAATEARSSVRAKLRTVFTGRSGRNCTRPPPVVRSTRKTPAATGDE